MDSHHYRFLLFLLTTIACLIATLLHSRAYSSLPILPLEIPLDFNAASGILLGVDGNDVQGSNDKKTKTRQEVLAVLEESSRPEEDEEEPVSKNNIVGTHQNTQAVLLVEESSCPQKKGGAGGIITRRRSQSWGTDHADGK
jgi:hypothetical protein